MAIGDITILTQPVMAGVGARKFNVAASATLIYPGEPVAFNALGDVVVIKFDNNAPVVATDFVVGIAATTSTNTAAAAGEVWVIPNVPGTVYLIAPKVAASYDTQAEYDALVGKRVLIDLTSTTFTLLAADNSTYGCIIQPLDVFKYPGKVAFTIKAGANYDA